MGDVYIILWNVFIRDEYLNGSVCIYILRYLRNWKIVNEIIYMIKLVNVKCLYFFLFVWENLKWNYVYIFYFGYFIVLNY